MIIMAIIAASGFIALGLSFISHKVRLEEEREAANITALLSSPPTWPGGPLGECEQ
jgi:hypothetical protein